MTRYAPTRARPLRKLLTRLELPRSSAFIDIGCGKGRAIMVAAALGFREIFGVEFVPGFLEQARRNMAAFRKWLPGDINIHLIECNATDYVFPHRDSIIYFCDPFSEAVLRKVLENLRLSLRDCPRRIWMIYVDLLFREAVEATGIFDDAKEYVYGGYHFTVFTRKRETGTHPILFGTRNAMPRQ